MNLEALFCSHLRTATSGSAEGRPTNHNKAFIYFYKTFTHFYKGLFILGYCFYFKALKKQEFLGSCFYLGYLIAEVFRIPLFESLYNKVFKGPQCPARVDCITFAHNSYYYHIIYSLSLLFRLLFLW